MTEPVMTGHNWSWISPKISRNVRDQGSDCGCGLLRSWEFAVLSVQVWSSPSLFPVLRLDFQTLLVTHDGREELDNSIEGRWTRDISQNTSTFSKKIPYVVVPQGGKKFVPLSKSHETCDIWKISSLQGLA